MTRGIGTDRRGDSVEGEKLTRINGLMIVAGVGATSPYASQEAWGIVFLLWIITLALVYCAWKYDQRYKKWKSML